MSLSDADWEAALRRHLAETLPEVIPGRPALSSLAPLADDVWLAGLSDGGRVVVKHQFYGLLTRDLPHDLLQTEFDVLRALRAAGCPVPVAFGADPEAQVIYLEYGGPRTLAQALTGELMPADDERRAWAQRLLSGLVHIESVLAAEPEWEGRAVPGGSRGELAQAWQAATDGAAEGLELTQRLLGTRDGKGAEEVAANLRELADALGQRPPSLGPTDYQPGNVVLDSLGPRLTFLELGKLGWDWTERRAIQYATPVTAPDRPGLVDAQMAGEYGSHWGGAEATARRDALDGHDLIFHLLWARRVCQSGGEADGLATLARRMATPLSGDPQVSGIRRQFGVLAAAGP